MLKKFFKSVLPSMAAFTFSSLYCIVDGFFVGRNVGDAGLAAVSIAYPLTALMQALGTGIGMGGAIQIATSRGKKERNCLFLSWKYAASSLRRMDRRDRPASFLL